MTFLDRVLYSSFYYLSLGINYPLCGVRKFWLPKIGHDCILCELLHCHILYKCKYQLKYFLIMCKLHFGIFCIYYYLYFGNKGSKTESFVKHSVMKKIN